MDPVVKLEQWLDDDLLREQIARGEDREQGDIELPGKAAAHKGNHARKEERQDERGDKDQRRVPVFVQDVALVPGVTVIVQRQRFWPGEESIANGVSERPQRGKNRPKDRNEPDRRR